MNKEKLLKSPQKVSEITQSPGIKKVENSINKIQGMLKHMDGILADYTSYKRNSELLKVIQDPDSGRVWGSQNMSFLQEHSGRESDLVTLLNIEDFSNRTS